MNRREIYDFIALMLKDPNQNRFTDAVITTVFVPTYQSEIKNLGTQFERYYLGTDTVTLTAGSDTVALPSDFASVVFSVFNASDNTQLTNNFAILEYADVGSGTPTRYSVVGNYLYFEAKPGANLSLTVYYSKVPTLPVLDSGTEVTFPNSELLAWLVIKKFLIMYRQDISFVNQEIVVQREEMKSMLSKRDFGTHKWAGDAFNYDFGQGEEDL